MFRCHVPKHLDCPITDDMQDCLNGDRSKLPALLSELRYWITHRRCEKTLQHLPATATETLPFLTLPEQELLQAGRHKIYVKLHRHPNIILASVELTKHEITFLTSFCLQRAGGTIEREAGNAQRNGVHLSSGLCCLPKGRERCCRRVGQAVGIHSGATTFGDTQIVHEANAPY